MDRGLQFHTTNLCQKILGLNLGSGGFGLKKLCIGLKVGLNPDESEKRLWKINLNKKLKGR